MKWISVKESLPTIPEEKAAEGCVQVKVLICDGIGEWMEAWYQPDKKEFFNIPGWLGWPVKNVTHWAIPELPNNIEESGGNK